MRSVSVRLADLDRVKINLGIAGENEHTHVLFDCKKAFDQYPNATPFLIVTPPRGDIYPAVVTRDGDIVEWVVTDSDLIYHGNGKVQLQFKQGDIIMKSYEAMTSIAKSSEPTGTVPTPIQNWITQANAILASIPDDINAALAAAKASGEFDGADGVGIAAITLKSTVGLVDTYTITLTDGRDYDFTVTNGTPGHNGVGIQSIAKTSTVGLVDTYTVTLTNGQTYPFTVTNGQNGVEIDDTTPANNKVFSSAKVAEELTDVKNAIQGLDDFLGDTYTDLGTHSVVTETDLTNMTASTATVQSVKFIITKTTISANGTASANAIRNAQDIELTAGYYCFSLDHPITSANYQIQLYDVDGNAVKKAFTSAQTIFDYYFTLESTKNMRIRAYAANGANVDNQLHTVTLKKISKQVYENNVAYFLIGLGDSERVFYTDIEEGSIDGTAGQPITGPTRCRTKDYINIDDFVMCGLTQKPNYDLYMFLYGSDKAFQSRIPGSWSNTIYTQSDIKTSYPDAKYIKIIFRRHNDASIKITDIAEMQGVIYVSHSETSIESFEGYRGNAIRSRFDEQFNYIAYSHLTTGDAPANTAEHFIHCAKQDFTALKGDVRNTADRGLIMCHDPGYTFDGNDKITAYNSSNKTLINTLTVAQCKALTFADQYDGQDCHPIDFDTYVKICKKYGKIAFVTVRDEAIDTVVAPYVIATLKKYRMMDRAIINSFTISTLTKFREFDSSIMLSLVLNQNTAPMVSTVDAVMTLGNCILNLFDVPLPNGSTLDGVLATYDPVIRYAINNNVMIYEAQTTNAQTDTLLAHGITGSHMTEIPDYNT